MVDRPDAKMPTPAVNDLDQAIYVMPERFYVAPPKGYGKLALLIGGVVLLLGLVITAVIISQRSTSTSAVNSAPVVVPVTQVPPAPLSTNTVDAAVLPTPTSSTPVLEPIATSTAESVAASTSTPVQVQDSDNDGLTDSEEVLYGTKIDIVDTDGDGYGDAAELLSGYSPLAPRATIQESGLFGIFSQSHYQISYPKIWQVQEFGSDHNEVLFQSGTGESVEVLRVVNPTNASLSEWYQSQFIGASAPIETVIAGTKALRSADSLHYYVINPADIGIVYALSYNGSSNHAFEFLTTFAIMVKSLVLR